MINEYKTVAFDINQQKIYNFFMKRIIPALFFALLFISCKTTNLESKLSPVYVTNLKKVNLLPPCEIEKSIDSEQLLNGTFGGAKSRDYARNRSK